MHDCNRAKWEQDKDSNQIKSYSNLSQLNKVVNFPSPLPGHSTDVSHYSPNAENTFFPSNKIVSVRLTRIDVMLFRL